MIWRLPDIIVFCSSSPLAHVSLTPWPSYWPKTYHIFTSNWKPWYSPFFVPGIPSPRYLHKSPHVSVVPMLTFSLYHKCVPSHISEWYPSSLVPIVTIQLSCFVSPGAAHHQLHWWVHWYTWIFLWSITLKETRPLSTLWAQASCFVLPSLATPPNSS